MNGTWHYREAERLAHLALDGDYLDGEPMRHRYALCAQVHATLALAAATALGAHPDGMTTSERQAWRREATGPRREVVEAEILDDSCGTVVDDAWTCGLPDGHAGDCAPAEAGAR